MPISWPMPSKAPFPSPTKISRSSWATTVQKMGRMRLPRTSPDVTRNVCQVLPRGINRGVEGILSNGSRTLKACRGEFIAFLEGDDLFLPGKITRQVDWMLAHPETVLCGHEVEIFDSATRAILGACSDRRALSAGVGAADIIRRGVPFCTPSIMVRGSRVPVYGFDPRLMMVGDWKLWIDVVGEDGRYGFLPDVLARYRRHSAGITTMSERAARVHRVSFTDLLVTIASVEASIPAFVADCQSALGRIFSAEALWLLEAGEAKLARTYLRRAFWTADMPIRAKAALWFAVSLLPRSLVTRVIRTRASAAAPAPRSSPADAS